MRHFMIAAVCAWVSLEAICVHAQSLPSRLKRSIEQELVPEYMDGNTLAVLQLGSQIASRMAPDRWHLIDEELRRHDLPDLGQLLVSIRLDLVRTNYGGRVPAPTTQEVRLMLPALEKEVREAIKAIATSPFMKSDASKQADFSSYELLLWQGHVAKNQLLNVSDLVVYGQKLARTQSARTSKRNRSDRNLDPAELDDLAQAVANTLRDIEERSIELRIQRIRYAQSVLQRKGDLVEQIKAAWVGDQDGYVLEKSLRASQGKTQFKRRSLRQKDLAESVKQTADDVRKLAGEPLMRKSRLLYTGLHWWMRGRYGVGPSGFGFLKNPTALNSPQELFGLYMPVEIPTPTAPVERYQIPETDRRHHYLWMFEYRRLTRHAYSGSSDQTLARNDRLTSRTRLARFY